MRLAVEKLALLGESEGGNCSTQLVNEAIKKSNSRSVMAYGQMLPQRVTSRDDSCLHNIGFLVSHDLIWFMNTIIRKILPVNLRGLVSVSGGSSDQRNQAGQAKSLTIEKFQDKLQSSASHSAVESVC
jgi:hypothetical protein